MFTLVTDKCKFFRVKRGQSGAEIEARFNVPVTGDVFGGRIIETDKRYSVYVAKVGDTYRSIAKAEGVDEDELKNANGGKPVYPSCRLFVPCKQFGA